MITRQRLAEMVREAERSIITERRQYIHPSQEKADEKSLL